MGFVKREVAENFISLGDGEGDAQQVGGILTRFVPNSHFSKPKTDYEFIDKAGATQLLSGSASLSRKIHAEDIGKFFKATFLGWKNSANGKYKDIDIAVWDGEPTEVMKAWPKFAQCYGKSSPLPVTAVAAKFAQPTPPPKDDFEDMPEPIRQGAIDDDLPFKGER